MKAIIATLFLIICYGYFVGKAQDNIRYIAEYKVTAVKKGEVKIVSESNIIETQPDIFLYVPNAFTPNEDGLNDSFGALGHGVKQYYLSIYNRWGEKIFESNNIANQWNGTYRGEKVMPGTYVYNISAKGYYDKEFHKEGTISIVKI